MKLEPYDENKLDLSKKRWIINEKKAKKLNIRNFNITDSKVSKENNKSFFHLLKQKKIEKLFIFLLFLLIILSFVSLIKKEDFNSTKFDYNKGVLKETMKVPTNFSLASQNHTNKTQSGNFFKLYNYQANNTMVEKCLELNLNLLNYLKEKDYLIKKLNKDIKDYQNTCNRLNETILSLKVEIHNLNFSLQLLKKENTLLINKTKTLVNTLDELATKYCCVRKVIDDKDYKFYLVNGTKVFCLERNNQNNSKVIKELKC